MEEKLHHNRPKYLNLLKIRQPIPAVVSILHRISGVLLFFPGIPLLLYVLQQLLESPQTFERLRDTLDNPMIKLILLLAIWFFLHHLCAGIRHLLLDIRIGINLPQARAGSKGVLIAGVVLTAAAGLALW
ncbi:succinate dehydrogenase, cytochrome b556 subunit [Nitrosomonas ureae]|uniref:Succinate dehydrogenase cytochrome b556 subunit n=1 Tax=Nitrosomonas ureae TaxID=44577 RepID=A0A1H9FYE3_9PROT|nr:succinate dehydrogenase, cytochrome b556 subunit [Nitrosomonas ureae]SEQ42861.1 succinate dehydrogenase / fumarate reductase cytochrome b subunit [Nitrosomonas ureae]